MASLNAFLSIPLGIRDQIIGQLFFPGELEDTSFEQKHEGQAYKAKRQISPYLQSKPKFDVAILRACRQLQIEGEAILYGTSSWNLSYNEYSADPMQSYELFEQFPRRLRRLVQRVERTCFGIPGPNSISRFEWHALMRFLAEECPALHTLRLWVPESLRGNSYWVSRCTEDDPWVQSILRIKTLRVFDMPVEWGSDIASSPQYLHLLPWLKESLTAEKQAPCPESRANEDKQPFNLLGLPLELQKLIYRHVVLSHNRRVYIDMGPWYNKNAQDCLSLMLTCKKLYIEVGTIFFAESIFFSHKPRFPILTYARSFRSGIVNRVRRYDWIDEEAGQAKDFTAHNKFAMKHLDLFWDLDMSRTFEFLVAPSRIWTLQPESLTIRCYMYTTTNLVHTITDCLYFLHDQRDHHHHHRTMGKDHPPPAEQDVDAEPVTKAEKWLIGLMASVPQTTFFHSDGAGHASWLSRRLREQWIRGNPGGPGLEWFFQNDLREGD